MPEGPEVRRMAESLQARLAGKSILRITITEKSRSSKNGLLLFNQLKYPLEINQIVSRGKRIIFHCHHLDRLTQNCTPFWLVSFLGMEGRWQFLRGSHSGIELHVGHSIYTRPILRVRETTVYFNDTRHFGALIICTNAAELQTTFARIGPDLLSDAVTFGDYIAVTRQKGLNNKEVAWFLMEQK